MNCTFERIDSETIDCVQCRRPHRWPVSRNGFPKRNCHPAAKPAARRLTWTGKLLIDRQPGDGVAWMAAYSGLAAFAKAWEAISGQPCGCGDRQARLNAAWKRLIWERFSELEPEQNPPAACPAPG